MNESKDNFFIEVLKFSLITLIIVLPFRLYIAKPFIVNGASMYPTFNNGHYLIVDQVSYNFIEEPQRGEVIVFKYPKDTSRFFIKRIIGLPEETVIMENGKVKIINKENPEGLYLIENYLEKLSGDNLNIKLSDDEYFVMGDNRNNSSDSRSWGPLKKEKIIGRVFLRLLPFTKIDLFPGNFNY